ncbi:MAG: RNA-guided endonuclease TnpB family protein [Methylovulum sp.]|nr:RNA-guided endonuclease TnpB family protein [Methylovulum sp.]
MIIAHKIALDLNNQQATYCQKAAGTARFSYNWALAEWNAQYQAWKLDNTQVKPSQAALRRQLNAVKRAQFPWMLEVTKNAPQMAIIQLGGAFKNFFAGRAKYPQYKKKGKSRDSFTLSNDQFAVKASRIRIPNLGWVRMRESLRFNGKILSATISRTANRWYASISVETEDKSHLPQAENQGVVGVDLGVKALATLSNGEVIAGAKPLKQRVAKLKRLSRALSRKTKGSANRHKAKQKIAKLHARIAFIRQNTLHQLTGYLTSCFHTIGIEDLNVKGMVKNRKLSRAISDMGFFEFRRQLEYKAQMRGGIVVVADRGYPSSKTCSVCKYVQTSLPLPVREWQCPNCQARHDRDINAAVNLANYAVSSTVSACGAEGSGSNRKARTKPAAVKQEINAKTTYG